MVRGVILIIVKKEGVFAGLECSKGVDPTDLVGEAPQLCKDGIQPNISTDFGTPEEEIVV